MRLTQSAFVHECRNTSVHETLKLENRNWKFGFYAFVLLINAFNFVPSFSTIALYSVTFNLDKTFFCRFVDN
jgi:hypothetical protein